MFSPRAAAQWVSEPVLCKKPMLTERRRLFGLFVTCAPKECDAPTENTEHTQEMSQQPPEQIATTRLLLINSAGREKSDNNI